MQQPNSDRVRRAVVRAPWLLLILAAAALLASPLLAATPGHITASLLASTEHPRPGASFLIGLRLTPDKGWHSYWSNPGESGLAPTIDWQGPAGLKFGPLEHPAPTVLKVMGITSFVHAGEHVLLSRVQASRSIAPGTHLPIEAQLSWLACSASLCVPGRAVLRLDLTAGDGAPGPASTFLKSAERRLPHEAGEGAFFVDHGDLVLRLPAGARLDGARAAFFPDRNGAFDPAAARASVIAGATEIRTRARGAVPGRLSGVVSDGRSAYRVTFRRTAPGPARSSAAASQELPVVQASAAVPRGRAPAPAGLLSASREAPKAVAPPPVLAALLAAMLGGFLLNLMPCVFPVLSIKAIALARAGTSERAAKADALAYALGSVISCAALGLMILVLRLMGDEVGWSFQLQHPGVTLLLALLAAAITLNLAGLFELPSLSFNARPAGANGRWSSMAAGALAAFVATPCSGPFMAAALGATFVFGPAMSLAIYAALGLGLAVPMLLVAFVPRLRKALPPPGDWMDAFRRWMALPTGLAALALMWLLYRQAGTIAVIQGTAVVLAFGVALGWVGWRQDSGAGRRWFALVPATAAIAGLALVWPAPAPLSAQASSATVQQFSEARLAQLRRAGVPVFVDISADWCLTCKINERIAIDRPETRAAFDEAGIVTLRGDWTNGDPAITRFLASNRRNSIPFYLFYPPGQDAEPLPQLLTAGSLRDLAEAVRGRRAGPTPAGAE